jgi:lauroyl/myristoyl acyltransferase
MVAFFFLGIYGRVIAYLPPWCVSLLGALLTRVALATSLRERVERGMRKFSLKRDYDVEDLARRHIRFLADVFHDMLYFRYHHRPQYGLIDKVKREGEDYLQEALKDKKGVILCSLHLGDFLWSISYLASAYPANLLVRGESDPRWEAFGLKMRQRLGIKGIYTEGAARKIKEKLKKGELVIFVIDQYILPFFHGTNHPLREVVPRLAQLTGVPVIPFYTLHDGKRVTVRFLPPLKEVSPSGLEAMMMQAINENPSLWFWWRRLGKIKRGERRH